MWSLRQAQQRSARARGPEPSLTAPAALTLRVATAEDLPRIGWLAALDSSSPPEPPVLIGEVDGEIWVASSLTDLGTVADPFRMTTHVRAMTLARAKQLRDTGSAHSGRRRPFGARRRTADRPPRPQSAT